MFTFDPASKAMALAAWASSSLASSLAGQAMGIFIASLEEGRLRAAFSLGADRFATAKSRDGSFACRRKGNDPRPDFARLKSPEVDFGYAKAGLQREIGDGADLRMWILDRSPL